MSIGRSTGVGAGVVGDLSTTTGCTHRGAGWRAESIIHITTRGLDRIIDSTIRMSTRAQEAKGYGPLERNNINTACRQGIEDGLDTRVACTYVCTFYKLMAYLFFGFRLIIFSGSGPSRRVVPEKAFLFIVGEITFYSSS